jgi:SAM-dependent methyltransferase
MFRILELLVSMLRPERTAPRSCSACETPVDRFLPLPAFYFEETRKHGFNHPWNKWEMLNVKEYSCPRCGASDRDRLMAMFLRRKLAEVPDGAIIRLVEFAPTPQISGILKGHPKLVYRSADLSRENVDDRADLTNLSIYGDESFDALICSHVLEHIADDLKAMRELFRILKNTGWGLLIVPISLHWRSIRERPISNTDSERWRYFGQNDHVRVYTRDGFTGRLREAGFRVSRIGIDEFGATAFSRHAIQASSAIYIVTRPQANPYGPISRRSEDTPGG